MSTRSEIMTPLCQAGNEKKACMWLISICLDLDEYPDGQKSPDLAVWPSLWDTAVDQLIYPARS